MFPEQPPVSIEFQKIFRPLSHLFSCSFVRKLLKANSWQLSRLSTARKKHPRIFVHAKCSLHKPPVSIEPSNFFTRTFSRIMHVPFPRNISHAVLASSCWLLVQLLELWHLYTFACATFLRLIWVRGFWCIRSMMEQGWLRMEKIGTDYKQRTWKV